MVKFDLRELSAPVENLREEVSKSYNQLDLEWSNISTVLRKLPIPSDVSSFAHSEHDEQYQIYLCWRKYAGKRRICLAEFHCSDPENESITPYEEWSGTQRLNMLKYVPKLFEACEKRTKQFITDVAEVGGKK